LYFVQYEVVGVFAFSCAASMLASKTLFQVDKISLRAVYSAVDKWF
jgi:hypothetical protein